MNGKIWILAALAAATFVPANAQDTKTDHEIVIVPEPHAVEKALRDARETRRLDSLSEVGDITIRLTEGVYELDQPLVLRPEDKGLAIVGDDGAVISGGITIKGWQRKGRLWVADVPDFNGRPREFRQLWVNGKKAVRARDVADFDQMCRIRAVDKQQQVIWVPAKAVRTVIDAPQAEMVLHQMWCVSVLRIKSISISGDSAAVSFHSPEAKLQFEHPWPAPITGSDGHDSPFYITNALSLLDTPGEWYLDTKTSKLYYMPLPGEDMATATVVAPMLETLVRMEGTPDRRVSDVTFSNVCFSHTTWRRPSFEGHVPLQTGMYLTEAYKLRPQMKRVDNHKLDNQGWLGRAAAAVSVAWSERVAFDGCTFQHLGGSGLDFVEGDADCSVEACRFDDVAMNGCVAGSFSPEGLETHLPYRPADNRVVCRGTAIRNSRFHDIGNDDWGCVAIAAGYVAATDIAHNEIDEVPYTGISVGWGWNRTPVCMGNNQIHHNLVQHYARHMYDVAAIYTLGNQPGTVISNNLVRDIYHPAYVHDPNHWFYIYLDEGSSNITVRDNWCPEQKFMKNANGPGNVWENNGPIPVSFVEEAGIQQAR